MVGVPTSRLLSNEKQIHAKVGGYSHSLNHFLGDRFSWKHKSEMCYESEIKISIN